MKRTYLPDFSYEDYLSFQSILIDGNLSEDGFYKKISELSKWDKIFNKRDTARKIREFMANNRITESDREIFNKILGDHHVLSKVVFVSDGSYRTNRIFFKKFNLQTEKSFSFDVTPYDSPIFKKFENLSPKAKINLLKNKCEHIFLHLISDKDAEMDKYFFEMMDDFLDDDYYERYYDYDYDCNCNHCLAGTQKSF